MRLVRSGGSEIGDYQKWWGFYLWEVCGDSEKMRVEIDEI